MKWLNLLSNNNKNPNFRLGRYSDYGKSQKQLDHWNKAMKAFENEQYEEMFEHFFLYLNDPNENNVKTSLQNDKTFELYQGSKHITGKIGNKTLRAEAKIAKANKMHIGFLRKMVEANFNFKYSRYAINENNELLLIFDSHIIDCAPHKLYHGLKEIATHADKRDDLLLKEFKDLEPVASEHITPFSNEKKQFIKKWMTKWMEETLAEAEHPSLDIKKYPGALAFLLLQTAYRIDALLKPEGKTMDLIEKIHKTYFTSNQLTIEQKNNEAIQILKNLHTQTDDLVQSDFYGIRSTFAITNLPDDQKINSHIETETAKMDWYIENNHHLYAMAIANYTAGYLVYYYSLPELIRELLLLYFRITQPGFFKELGFSPSLVSTPVEKKQDHQLRPAQKAIEKELKKLHNTFNKKLVNLQFKWNHLQYQNMAAFAKSYLLMIKDTAWAGEKPA